MRRFAMVCISIGLSAALAAPSHAQSYDLVINGGRVMDPETMYDDIANVGVTVGRIAVITKDKISGKETIDAEGWWWRPGSSTHTSTQ